MSLPVRSSASTQSFNHARELASKTDFQRSWLYNRLRYRPVGFLFASGKPDLTDSDIFFYNLVYNSLYMSILLFSFTHSLTRYLFRQCNYNLKVFPPSIKLIEPNNRLLCSRLHSCLGGLSSNRLERVTSKNGEIHGI